MVESCALTLHTEELLSFISTRKDQEVTAHDSYDSIYLIVVQVNSSSLRPMSRHQDILCLLPLFASLMQTPAAAGVCGDTSAGWVALAFLVLDKNMLKK